MPSLHRTCPPPKLVSCVCGRAEKERWLLGGRGGGILLHELASSRAETQNRASQVFVFWGMQRPRAVATRETLFFGEYSLSVNRHLRRNMKSWPLLGGHSCTSLSPWHRAPPAKWRRTKVCGQWPPPKAKSSHRRRETAGERSTCAPSLPGGALRYTRIFAKIRAALLDSLASKCAAPQRSASLLWET